MTIYIYYTYAYFNAPVYIGTLLTTALHASCCLEQVRPRSSGWCPGNRGDSRRLALAIAVGWLPMKWGWVKTYHHMTGIFL